MLQNQHFNLRNKTMLKQLLRMYLLLEPEPTLVTEQTFSQALYQVKTTNINASFLLKIVFSTEKKICWKFSKRDIFMILIAVVAVMSLIIDIIHAARLSQLKSDSTNEASGLQGAPPNEEGCSCESGATCVRMNSNAFCVCPEDKYGSKCQHSVSKLTEKVVSEVATQLGSRIAQIEEGMSSNACLYTPCLNGGTCINIYPNTYQCRCPHSYSGYRCQYGNSDPEPGQNVCSSAPCQNGGTCHNLYPSSYFCYCLAGFQGNLCQDVVESTPLLAPSNVCSSDPCQNEGTCVDIFTAYVCACRFSFYGSNCEKSKFPSPSLFLLMEF